MSERFDAAMNAGEWFVQNIDQQLCQELEKAMVAAGVGVDSDPEVAGLAHGLLLALEGRSGRQKKTPTDNIYAAYSNVDFEEDIPAAIKAGLLRDDGSYYCLDRTWIRPDGSIYEDK